MGLTNVRLCLQKTAEERLAAAVEMNIEPFKACGLMPAITNVHGGDCVLFDTRTFHGGCSAQDPTGASGNGVDNLLRAIYILGMSPARLQTAEMLEARRVAYEL